MNSDKNWTWDWHSRRYKLSNVHCWAIQASWMSSELLSQTELTIVLIQLFYKVIYFTYYSITIILFLFFFSLQQYFYIGLILWLLLWNAKCDKSYLAKYILCISIMTNAQRKINYLTFLELTLEHSVCSRGNSLI